MDSNADHYTPYKETRISNRFIKHADLLEILPSLTNNPIFTTEVAGYSFEGRSLNLIKAGTGETRVFIWSQMHGDEATATMAICDLINFLAASSEGESSGKYILENCTLFILPMVSPDGAEVFNRRNAQGIDINRDFHRQQTPEGRVLRRLRDEIKPHFGFNMHDQSTMWSTGNTGKPATISLLAPAYDAALSVNAVRERAMQVISIINTELQRHIPGFVARFDDEYEPRAFGDNFQAAGTSTILIEAGGFKDDPEKQFIRQLTYTALLTALKSIASKSYANVSLANYFDIPENDKRHYHLVLRNCKVSTPVATYKVDIGLVADEKLNPDHRSVTYTYLIEDVGDLTGYHGYEEIEASNYNLILTRPLIVGEGADFILQDQLSTVLCVENGRITNKNL
ncbi:carboxypeptidase [Flavihumibacter sp. R14]|nr:carboxypeptidase [Flavihumibacter soli]